MRMNLEGRNALVTGATRGIGRAIALALADAGAAVVGTGTSEVGASEISVMLSSAPVAGKGMVLDVTEPDSVDALFAGLKVDDHQPDIIVNNAGITRDGLLARLGDPDWHAVLDTNLNSVYRVCKAGVRHLMKARGGRIVNVTSVVSSLGNAGQSNYAAAKAGIEGFTRSLARELGGRAITVNSVAPGFIETDMTRALNEEKRRFLMAQVPVGRFGTPEEVADAVVFLASPCASYITGHTLHVNGGMYMI